MNAVIFSPLLPVWVLGIGALVLMLAIALGRNHKKSAFIAMGTLNIALITLLLQNTGVLPRSDFGVGLFSFDGFFALNAGVVLLCALGASTLSLCYFARLHGQKDELYLLLLLATMGAVLMAGATHLASFFMALELLSVPMYGMVAYEYIRQKSLEAGIKYLVLSAAASATLLMGMAWIFAQFGVLDFASIGTQIGTTQDLPILAMAGGAMILMAIGFKLSLVPFHTWTADVYQGAPLPIAAFLGSASKVAMMALATRALVVMGLPAFDGIYDALFAMVLVSAILGNLLALFSDNLKRMLGYASIAQMAYAIMAVLAIGHMADGVVSAYMAIYALSSLGAFGVMALMSSAADQSTHAREAVCLSDYQGLFWHRPVLTVVMTVMLLSMAGIPLTAGFISKILVAYASVQGKAWWLLGVLIIGSVLGVVYYLRTMLIMFKRPVCAPFDAPNDWARRLGGMMVLLCALIVLVLGVFPSGLVYFTGLAHIG